MKHFVTIVARKLSMLPPISQESAKNLLRIIEYLSSACIQVPGLYRRLGDVAEQKHILASVEKGAAIDFKKYSPHSVTSVMKQVGKLALVRSFLPKHPFVRF